MGFIPAISRALSPKHAATDRKPASEADCPPKLGKDGRWTRRRSKGDVMPLPNPEAGLATAPTSIAGHNNAATSYAGATSSPPASHAAAPPFPIPLSTGAINSTFTNPSSSSPLQPSSTSPPANSTSTTAQPRPATAPRIPSVMYCPVLDKQGFGYGNEERRRADFL